MYSINFTDKVTFTLSKYFYVIIVFGFISHIFGNYYYSSTFTIPGEMIQYLKRFVFFILSYKLTKRIMSYNGINKIINITIIIFSLALLIGLLQMVGVTQLAELYGRSEKQTSVALRAGSDFKMIGTAGMGSVMRIFPNIFCFCYFSL